MQKVKEIAGKELRGNLNGGRGTFRIIHVQHNVTKLWVKGE